MFFYFFHKPFINFKIFHIAIQAINLKHKTTSSSQVIMETMVLMDIQAIDLKMISNNHLHRSIVQQINMFHHKTIHRNGKKKSLQTRNNNICSFIILFIRPNNQYIPPSSSRPNGNGNGNFNPQNGYRY